MVEGAKSVGFITLRWEASIEGRLDPASGLRPTLTKEGRCVTTWDTSSWLHPSVQGNTVLLPIAKTEPSRSVHRMMSIERWYSTTPCHVRELHSVHVHVTI